MSSFTRARTFSGQSMAGRVFVLSAVAVGLTACSADIGRFDFPVMGYNSGASQQTTGSVAPPPPLPAAPLRQNAGVPPQPPMPASQADQVAVAPLPGVPGRPNRGGSSPRPDRRRSQPRVSARRRLLPARRSTSSRAIASMPSPSAMVSRLPTDGGQLPDQPDHPTRTAPRGADRASTGSPHDREKG